MDLQTELNASAPSLTPYEKERFSSDMENLLKLISTGLSKSRGKKRLFSFKQRVLPATVQENFAQREIMNKPREITTTGKDYVLERRDSTFENLESCTVTSEKGHSDNDSGSGSLSFYSITGSIINLQKLYFKVGSIFMTDCKDSIILLRLPSDGDIQIRSRNLENCKFSIDMVAPDRDCKQVVIIENCHDCVFNAGTREHLVIQDFSNPFQSNGTEDSSAFAFKEFDTCDKDTMRLKQTYL
ncbi:hypothetical protein SEUBUCD646_0P00500 [Saccharomyces eubayanus]|uniref:C-CAP/cofactor C-like domain-containing protein n=1 Tax=Saccharomyces eubayanus TaxID=1080349 RepID=A0ABN8VIU1_SACEU|nr:hypothetical protein SEUBUCD650_0P00510 [Saccharomyces eubayanus]CAI1779442.1 hypothetical protein SEUBUCD646_0P00500 [Saccharomyces eubayanus]